MQYRITKQKSLIYSIIMQNGHLTVDELIELLKQQDLKISLSTIYRNLNILTQEGKIKKIKSENKSSDETIKEHHYHFECNSCHQVFDVDPSLVQIKIHHSAAVITKKDLFLYGICESCKKNLDNKEKEKWN